MQLTTLVAARLAFNAIDSDRDELISIEDIDATVERNPHIKLPKEVTEKMYLDCLQTNFPVPVRSYEPC